MEISKLNYKGIDSLLIKTDFYEMIVTISMGPRILKFSKLGGLNILCDDGQFSIDINGEIWNIIGGHRLWHSPEAFPRTYFPDNKPVEYILDNEAITLLQSTDESNIQKEIKIIFHGEKVELIHKMKNCGVWPISFSVWPITILSPGGVAKMPLSDEKTGLTPNRNIVFWDYSKINDERLEFSEENIYIHQNKGTTPFKIGINSNKGICEYILKDNTFIKEFDVEVDVEYPDKGCNLEVYTCDYMLEMETLSPLKLVAAGKSICHREIWSII